MNKKILFYASGPNQIIGYSRSANIISNFLADQSTNTVYYFGVGGSNSDLQRTIHPKINYIDVNKEIKEFRINNPNFKTNDKFKDYFGIDMFQSKVNSIKPEIIFIYNDIVVVNRLLNELLLVPKQVYKYKIYIYLDLVYKFEKLDLLMNIHAHADKIFVFSSFWKDHLLELGIPSSKVYVLHLGFDEKIFTQLSLEKCEEVRNKLNFLKEDFIVFNSNRNCYRKGNDITIRSFLIFLKNNSIIKDNKIIPNKNIKLFLNCSIKDFTGFDLLSLIKVECLIHGFDYNHIIYNHIFSTSSINLVTDEILNEFYNICDVGINTCLGEGFGLCNLEHGYLGKPQIVSNVGGLSEIFKEFRTVHPTLDFYIPKHLDWHVGYVSVCSPEGFVKHLQELYDDKEKRLMEGIRLSTYIKDKFNWSSILSKFNEDFKI